MGVSDSAATVISPVRVRNSGPLDCQEIAQIEIVKTLVALAKAILAQMNLQSAADIAKIARNAAFPISRSATELAQPPPPEAPHPRCRLLPNGAGARRQPVSRCRA